MYVFNESACACVVVDKKLGEDIRLERSFDLVKFATNLAKMWVATQAARKKRSCEFPASLPPRSLFNIVWARKRGAPLFFKVSCHSKRVYFNLNWFRVLVHIATKREGIAF